MLVVTNKFDPNESAPIAGPSHMLRKCLAATPCAPWRRWGRVAVVGSGLAPVVPAAEPAREWPAHRRMADLTTKPLKISPESAG